MRGMQAAKERFAETIPKVSIAHVRRKRLGAEILGPHHVSEKEINMITNCRFALDEKRNVIDLLNPANSGKGYCHEGDPEDDRHLRERVLMVRLGEMPIN